jgi:uncharacterized membrane protein
MTSLGIAALMATQGFWPVLPFAGLEMLVLGWALAISLCNAMWFSDSQSRTTRSDSSP